MLKLSVSIGQKNIERFVVEQEINLHAHFAHNQGIELLEVHIGLGQRDVDADVALRKKRLAAPCDDVGKFRHNVDEVAIALDFFAEHHHCRFFDDVFVEYQHQAARNVAIEGNHRAHEAVMRGNAAFHDAVRGFLDIPACERLERLERGIDEMQEVRHELLGELLGLLAIHSLRQGGDFLVLERGRVVVVDVDSGAANLFVICRIDEVGAHAQKDEHSAIRNGVARERNEKIDSLCLENLGVFEVEHEDLESLGEPQGMRL